MLFKKEPKIEFLCQKEDWGIIPEPYKAKKYIPDWFKSLPMKLGPGLNQSTVKRCNPFFDSMSIGWIIPLAADIEIKSNSNASGLDYSWDFYKPLIENHNPAQVTTEKNPNPIGNKPPIKFLNYWAVKVPKGYSVLFVPPLNRPDERFSIMSGFVDCDGYFEYINFPFVWTKPDFHGILPAGTPLVQAIPIKRNTLIHQELVRTFTEEDNNELEWTRRKRKATPSHYRDTIWSKK
jgi:hypothetical protein